MPEKRLTLFFILRGSTKFNLPLFYTTRLLPLLLDIEAHFYLAPLLKLWLWEGHLQFFAFILSDDFSEIIKRMFIALVLIVKSV